MSVGPRRLIGGQFSAPERVTVSDTPSSWKTRAGDTVEIFVDRPGPGNPLKWYWRVLAPNGKQVASSGQGFTRARSARRAARRMFPEASS